VNSRARHSRCCAGAGTARGRASLLNFSRAHLVLHTPICRQGSHLSTVYPAMGAVKTWVLQLVASAYRTKRAESARPNPIGQVSTRCEPRRQCERQDQLDSAGDESMSRLGSSSAHSSCCTTSEPCRSKRCDATRQQRPWWPPHSRLTGLRCRHFRLEHAAFWTSCGDRWREQGAEDRAGRVCHRLVELVERKAQHLLNLASP
jgi:hypothetical protein